MQSSKELKDISALVIEDMWIKYPWDAVDIEEHTEKEKLCCLITAKEKTMSISAIVGAQWGRRKGRVVDYLATKADLCIRFKWR